MKNLKFILPVVAFLAAFSASFALKADKSVAQELWYVDGSGNPIVPVNAAVPNCTESSENCARLFEMVDGRPEQPIGSIIPGTKQ